MGGRIFPRLFAARSLPAVLAALLALAAPPAQAQPNMDEWCAAHAETCGHFETAFELTNAIEVPLHRIDAILENARALSAVGLEVPARHNFEVALRNVVASYERLDARSRGLTDVGVAQYETGLTDDATVSFDGALEVALAIESDNDRARMVMEFAGDVAEIGLWERALEAAHRIPEDRPEYARALAAIALSQGEAGELEAAAATAGAIPEASTYRGQTLADLARLQAEAGDADAAEALIARAMAAAGSVENDAGRSFALQAVVNAELARGDLDGATAAAAEIPDQTVWIESQVAIAIAQAEAGDAEAAAAILAAARARADAVDGLGRVMALTPVVNGLASIGHWDAAAEAIASIDDQRHRDSLLYDVGRTARQVQDWDTALDFIEQIERERIRLTEIASLAADQHGAGVAPDQVAETLAAAADAAASADPDAAGAVFVVLGRVQAEMGDLAAARESLGHTTYESDQGAILLAIVRAHLAAGDLEAAIATAEEITDSHKRSEAMAEVVAGLADAAVAAYVPDGQ
ncbi:MAG: hypothetical protein KDA49_16805 [Rhodospirillaceae bacterium]|nr:hypothetical protein [Rhodospirillaceae bacterium]